MMGRALSPGATLSHYRIISSLGAGGMGEVYVAQDLALDRSVALKILPPAMVRNEERVSRFIQEAKAASALNHPHIVTIYEIGQANVQPGTGDVADTATVASGPIHYIAMELVSGDTLSREIHRGKTDLRTLLGYMVQVAEGLAKAHTAGIVHRDLKPENIMVSGDGYAKVLDFGLAKLTEAQDLSKEETSLPTQTPPKTTEGVVMGTAGYMSPEQVQGKGVDHRSDIFSFGCILYEATTRARPFAADSTIETMHKILAEKPVAVEELNPEAPGELRRLIRRCLAKSPEQRLQSMKDLALDLREIVDEFESLSLTSATHTSGAAPVVAGGRPGARTRLLVGAAALIGLAGLSFGIYGWSHRGSVTSRPEPFQSMHITRLTTSGNIVSAVLSADGRYLGQSVRDHGRWSLWMKQISTGSQVQIVPPQDVVINRIRFSPDGEYIYYLSVDLDAPLYSTLFQIPSLGGTPRKLLFDIDTAVTFSPDGKQVAFVRGYPHLGESALMVANANGGAERKLAIMKQPHFFQNFSPSWSPDGRCIAAAIARGSQLEVVTVDIATGNQAPLGGPLWQVLTGLAWLPDASGVVVSAARRGGSIKPQIWQIAFPDGEVSRVTNDTNAYNNVSVTADARCIATIQINVAANLWVAAAATPSVAKQITFDSSEESFDSFALGPNGTIVFTSVEDRSVQLYAMALDGSGRRRLTTGPGLNQDPRIARDVVVFTSFRDGQVPHVWKMDLGGGDLAQVTNGTGEFVADVDPAGRSALYTRLDSVRSLWRIPLTGGTPERVVTPGSVDFYIGSSPDGQRLAYTCLRQEPDRVYADIVVLSTAGGEQVFRHPVPEGAYALSYVWAPNGDALDYARFLDGKGNIWRLPLAGGEPQRLTDFQDLQIFDFAWSADGEQLVLSRGELRSDVVLISDFR